MLRATDHERATKNTSIVSNIEQTDKLDVGIIALVPACYAGARLARRRGSFAEG